MTKPTAGVLYAPGTNSHQETLVAFERAGASSRLLFLTEILAGNQALDDCDVLCIPGGFSFGDHLGAGALAGAYLREKLNVQLQSALRKPVLAICNGFQTAMRAGVFGSRVALDINESGTFHHEMYQHHVVDVSANCVWLRGLEGEELQIPCAHGEGRFTYRPEVSAASDAYWRPALRYPQGANPDGSMDDIAGICTSDGMVFGLMNHPERLLSDPRNQRIFINGVEAAR